LAENCFIGSILWVADFAGGTVVFIFGVEFDAFEIRVVDVFP
jgi:hypothetical protein